MGYTSRLRRSILALMALAQLVSKFPTELATHLQRRMNGARSASLLTRAALASPMTIWGYKKAMPYTTFSADPLKTGAVHKE